MQFTYSTGKNSICDDIDFLCRSTSASYPLLDKTRNVNNAYHNVARLIWESCDDWAYDDSNATDSPVAHRTLAHASAVYQIPTTAFSIEGAEIKDINGDWWKLQFKNYHDLDISQEEFWSTPGRPAYYDLNGNDIRLFPAPNSAYTTLSSGLCLRLSRDITEFTSGSTTSPGFPVPFHRLLSYSAALDYEKDPNQRNLLIAMKDRLEKGLSRFYSHRAVESPNKIQAKSKRHWRQYL